MPFCLCKTKESIFGGAGRTTGGSDTTHTCGKLLDMNMLRCTALRCAAQRSAAQRCAGIPSRPGQARAGIPSRRRDPEPGQARAGILSRAPARPGLGSANSEWLFVVQITAGRPRT